MKLVILITLLASTQVFSAAPKDPVSWKKITAKHSWMADTGCWWKNSTIYSTGKFRTESCDGVRTGYLKAEKLAKINLAMTKVLRLQSNEYVCSDRAMQDYYWDYTIKTSVSEKKYFFNNGQSECSRSGGEEEFSALEFALAD